VLKDGAVNREHNDQCGGYVDWHAENTFQRDKQMADQPRDIVAAVCPGRRQLGYKIGIENKADRNHWHDPASGASRRFQHEDDEDSAQNHVPFFRHSRTIGEIIAMHERVDDRRNPEQRWNHVEPLDAIAEAISDRKQQETQQQNESNVSVTQRDRRYDVIRGIEMKQRHSDRDRRNGRSDPTRKPVAAPSSCWMYSSALRSCSTEITSVSAPALNPSPGQ